MVAIPQGCRQVYYQTWSGRLTFGDEAARAIKCT